MAMRLEVVGGEVDGGVEAAAAQKGLYAIKAHGDIVDANDTARRCVLFAESARDNQPNGITLASKKGGGKRRRRRSE